MRFYSVFIQSNNGVRNAADVFLGLSRFYGSKDEADAAKAGLKQDSPKYQFFVR